MSDNDNTTAQNPESAVSVSTESDAMIALAAVINYLDGESLAVEASSVGMEAIRQRAIYGLTGEIYGAPSDKGLTKWIETSMPKKKQVEAIADIALEAIELLQANGTKWTKIDDPEGS